MSLILVEKSNLSKTLQSKEEDNDSFHRKRSFLKDSSKLHGYFARKQNEKKQRKTVSR